jgi:hypothetical protein
MLTTSSIPCKPKYELRTAERPLAVMMEEYLRKQGKHWYSLPFYYDHSRDYVCFLCAGDFEGTIIRVWLVERPYDYDVMDSALISERGLDSFCNCYFYWHVKEVKEYIEKLWMLIKL